ncbi:MAG TPA: beta-galactosidase GalA [bacterium]|nr:beta-galactosidase GalA [bacterium]
MKMSIRIILPFLWAVLGLVPSALSHAAQTAPPREHLLMDFGWRFALGHAADPDKDFGFGKAYFSYFAKAGKADGPAAPDFDDRGWRILDLPHDWAVEVPFDEKASYSHGYKALGRAFPENSVGWYRKSFFIPKEDKGKRISLEFDGVFRDSVVWVNGIYLGREQSGYNNFRYDITDELNWGADNTVSVRVDATWEEGWFYEGAGIYRHVWLAKTAPLHVDYNGVFVTSKPGKGPAEVAATTTLVNENLQGRESFQIIQNILDADGKSVANGKSAVLSLAAGVSQGSPVKMRVAHPRLWSLEDPHLYKLVTTIQSGGKVVDRVENPFGIRTLAFDSDKGFFLNGKHVELKGTSNHQDHAGVGEALPDALQEYRIRRLKSFGCNAYRCSHNPPTPELLDACDRLGMLVLTENRLMGTSPELLDRFKRQILLERNHPCIFAWSMGNEEWGIEFGDFGTQIGASLQAFVKRLDPTRFVTAAIDGGWGQGTSKSVEVMGFNYLDHGDTDDYHAKHPNQPSFATEEATTHQSRGIYDETVYGREGPTDRNDGKQSIERIWKYYEQRPYLGGLFLWTGFDYRGEEDPFHFPAVSSQYGVLDLCGFPKDCADYLACWWKSEPALFLTPHWNWKEKEGQEIVVWAFSNCQEVELFLNGKSLGKKAMPKDSHLEWKVPYEPGTLSAKGYNGGKVSAEAKEETAGDPASVALSADRDTIKADGEDVSVVTVSVLDKEGRPVPTAANEIHFSLEGPGRIIGVGNGDPVCHEPDRYFDTVTQIPIRNLKMKDGGPLGVRPEVEPGEDDSHWPALFSGRNDDQGEPCKEEPKGRVVRGSFELSAPLADYSEIILYPKPLVDAQAVFVNGHLIADKIGRDDKAIKGFVLPKDILKPGHNTYAVVGKELLRRWKWEELNQDPGFVRAVIPAGEWKRSLFSGLAQVIVQSGRNAGPIILKASSQGLEAVELKLNAEAVPLRPFVPVE